MTNKDNQPKKYDLVLGGNNPPPTHSLVLGGIKGVKRQFNHHAQSDEEKTNLLRESLKYGEEAEEFLSDIFTVSEGKIKWMAAAFMSATNNQIYKEILVDYFAKVILTNPEDWNKWRKEIPEIKIYLQGLKIYDPNKNLYDSQETWSLKSIKIDLSNTNLINSNWSSCIFEHSNFNNTDFCQANLSCCHFSGTEFKRTKFVGANLEEASFTHSQLTEVDFKQANLKGVSFESNYINRIKFKNIDFRKTSVPNFKYYSYYEYINFRHSSLTEVSLENCNLKSVIFAYMEKVTFNNCNLVNAEFRGRINDVVFEDSNLSNSGFMYYDLKKVVFKQVNLQGANFRWCDLSKINFTGLDVRGANFARSTFGDNNSLEKANTEGAKFSSIDKPTREHMGSFPLFPKKLINPDKLKGALFSNEYYYEAGAE